MSLLHPDICPKCGGASGTGNYIHKPNCPDLIINPCKIYYPPNHNNQLFIDPSGLSQDEKLDLIVRLLQRILKPHEK
jgi:hypothetical protein